MSKSRTETWLALIVLAAGLLVTAILGLFVYMSATPPLHPNPQDVPSVSGATPVRQWADAVEQARQIVPAALTEQNLPGLSVAVGAGSEIVWVKALVGRTSTGGELGAGQVYDSTPERCSSG